MVVEWGGKKKKEKQLWNTYGCVSERPLASSEGVGGSGVSGLGGGGEAGEGAGLVQCTKPFQGHLCCYTFKNEYRKRKKKKNKWHLAKKQSILVLVIFIVRFPLLFFLAL